MIDPNEYQVLQDAFFASFTGIDRPCWSSPCW